nr:MAG TPA: hypothetical protein [Caudoviricetes sp.]
MGGRGRMPTSPPPFYPAVYPTIVRIITIVV